jgi:hypothetical protein
VLTAEMHLQVVLLALAVTALRLLFLAAA